MLFRSFCVALASAWTVVSLRPRLRIVSIIPGIESRAPERTATRFGAPMNLADLDADQIVQKVDCTLRTMFEELRGQRDGNHLQ